MYTKFIRRREPFHSKEIIFYSKETLAASECMGFYIRLKASILASVQKLLLEE